MGKKWPFSFIHHEKSSLLCLISWIARGREALSGLKNLPSLFWKVFLPFLWMSRQPTWVTLHSMQWQWKVQLESLIAKKDSGYSGKGDEKDGLRNDKIAGSGKMAFFSLLFKVRQATLFWKKVWVERVAGAGERPLAHYPIHEGIRE